MSENIREARDISELSLVKRAAVGEEWAARRVLEIVMDRVRTTVIYLGGDDRDTDDWVQLSLLEILGSLHGYRGESSLCVWADRITVRTTLRHLKKRRWRERLLSERWDTKHNKLSAQDWNDPHLERMLCLRVVRTLKEISLKFRVPLVLKLIGGYQVNDIATMMTLPENTVKGRLKKGRRLFKKKALRDEILLDWVKRGYYE